MNTIKLISTKEEFLATKGFVAVEMALGKESFGADLEVIDDGGERHIIPLDHHNQYSRLPSACIQAMDYQMVKEQTYKNFVSIKGSIDADAILTIAIMACGLPYEKEVRDFIEVVGRLDTRKPVKTIQPQYYLLKQIIGDAKKSIQAFPENEEVYWEEAIYQTSMLLRYYEDKHTVKNALELQEADAKAQKKRREVAEAVQVTILNNGIALRITEVQATDIWYETNNILACYNPKLMKGVLCAKHIINAQALTKSSKGLMALDLPDGWGGRETIIGTPRNIKIKESEFVQIIKNIKGVC